MRDLAALLLLLLLPQLQLLPMLSCLHTDPSIAINGPWTMIPLFSAAPLCFTHLQVWFLSNGRTLCILHDQAQGSLHLRQHAHQVPLRHCRGQHAAGQGGGAGQGWPAAAVVRPSSIASRASKTRKPLPRHRHRSLSSSLSPAKAIAISSRLWPSGDRSCTKILTATRCPRHRASNTSPDAPSPAAATGVGGRVGGRVGTFEGGS